MGLSSRVIPKVKIMQTFIEIFAIGPQMITTFVKKKKLKECVYKKGTEVQKITNSLPMMVV